MKKDFVLSVSKWAGVIGVYKMYAHIDRRGPRGTKMDSAPAPKYSIRPVNPEIASYLKLAFEYSIAHEESTYAKGPGKEPVGYCIMVKFHDDPFQRTFFGSSVKSDKDRWDRRVGLKVAYQELSESIRREIIGFSKTEMREIAKLVGL